eukprot:2614997-Prymnesium_polylepis.2
MHIARTLTTPREPTSRSADREMSSILDFCLGHAEAVAAEVARRAHSTRRSPCVRVRHQQGGSTSQRSGRRQPGERSNARPAKSLVTLERKIAATA